MPSLAPSYMSSPQIQHSEQSQAKVFAVIFVFSLLLLALGPYSNVSPIGTLDPWIYTGYFQNFHEMVTRYGQAYYVARLPYILPGIGLYQVFTPPVANWILNGLLFTGVLAPLYIIATRHFGQLVALAAVALGASNAYLASTIIWDYPDGPAIAYAMLGLWLCLAPPRRLPDRTALLLAGSLWMMAGITNFICIFVLVGLALTAAVWRGHNLRTTIVDTGYVIMGALLSLGFWCLVSRLTIDTWNILGPQWGQVRYASENKDYLPDMWGRGNAWIPRAFRQLPTVTLILFPALLLLRHDIRTSPFARPLVASLLGLVFSLGFFAWVEFGMDKVLLRVFYHSSYLIAPVFLVCLAVIATIWTQAVTRPFCAAFTTALCIAPFLPTVTRGYWHLPRTELPWLIAALAASAMVIVPTRTTTGRLVAAMGLVALCSLVSLGPALDQSVRSMVFRPKEALFVPDRTSKIIAGEAAYQLELASDLQVFLKNGRFRQYSLRFWYDPDEPAKKLFDSLYSTYLWGYVDLTQWFKTKPCADLEAFFHKNGRILHITSDPSRIAAHREIMTARGVSWREIGTWTLGQRGHQYRIALDEITFP